MGVINKIDIFLFKGKYPSKDYRCITEEMNFFREKYSRFTKWNYNKFSLKLDKYIKKVVRPAAKKFCRIYFTLFNEQNYTSCLNATELEDEIVEEVKRNIRKMYSRENEKKEEKVETISKNKGDVPKPSRAKSGSFALAENNNSFRLMKSNSSKLDDKSLKTVYHKVELTDFIDGFKELGLKYGEDRWIDIFLELQKSKDYKEKVCDIIEKLSSEMEDAELFFIDRYGMKPREIVDKLLSSLNSNRNEQTTKYEVPALNDFMTDVLLKFSRTQEFLDLWDLMNYRRGNPLEVRQAKKTIDFAIVSLSEKNSEFKDKITKMYHTDNVEKIASNISEQWESMVIKNDGRLWKNQKNVDKKVDTFRDSQGIAEVTTQFFNCNTELECTKNMIASNFQEQSLEEYIYTTDELISKYIKELKELYSSIKENNKEQFINYLNLMEDVYGVVLNNECELDAFLEIIEAELHFYQLKSCLDYGVSMERLSQISKHNARKIERELLSSPILIRELLLVNEPNYSFNTNLEINITSDLKLPDDYENKYISGSGFRKSLYQASLVNNEENDKVFQVKFQRKNWLYSINPNKGLVIYDENGNEVEIDSYLLIEVQKEMKEMANLDLNNTKK